MQYGPRYFTTGCRNEVARKFHLILVYMHLICEVKRELHPRLRYNITNSTISITLSTFNYSTSFHLSSIDNFQLQGVPKKGVDSRFLYR